MSPPIPPLLTRLRERNLLATVTLSGLYLGSFFVLPVLGVLAVKLAVWVAGSEYGSGARAAALFLGALAGFLGFAATSMSADSIARALRSKP